MYKCTHFQACTISANLPRVSHDSTRIKLARTTVPMDGSTVNLPVCMAVSVKIKTGKCRVISYFLSPLLRYSSESLRERE